MRRDSAEAFGEEHVSLFLCVSLSRKAQHMLFSGEEVQSAFSKEWREAQRQRMNAMPREGSDTPVKLDPITRRMLLLSLLLLVPLLP